MHPTRLILLAISFIATAIAITISTPTTANERPNFLWITSEDNSADWLGCYGNEHASTPRLDQFANESILFEHAYSNGPVCAVARSTLFTGMYATTLGTHHMRSRYAIPQQFRPYVSYLREAGYYCTNNSKTDYNFEGVDESWWDESSDTAHYRNRPEGAPFFAIFNFTTSHESSLFRERTRQFRKSKLIPQDTRLAPADVPLPPLFPDLAEVRRDIATYHDVISALDQQVGEVLDELEAAGLAENTIVFYYSDHGGILPRSKRYLYDTGTHVPLIIHLPEKYRRANTPAAGSRVSDLVAFVDFAPTLLSLAGIDVPPHFQGSAFLGSQRPGDRNKQKPHVFLFADRFDETVRMHRAITDGKYRYVHNFYPHLTAALQNEYPYGIASWRAWRAAAQQGTLSAEHQAFWRTPQPTAELFDVQSDPWEVHNLMASNGAEDRAALMRKALRQTMLDTRDLGMIPEAMWNEVASEQTIFDYAHGGDFPWQDVVDLAFKASDQDAANLPEFRENLQHAHPVMRYWAAVGCLELGAAMAPARAELEALQKDPHAVNRITAAHALYRLDASPRPLGIIASEATRVENDASATLALHTLYQLDATQEVSSQSLKRIGQAVPNSYAARWANRLLQARR